METSSKIHKPETYKEAISDLIHSWYWKSAIEKEIQDLENHHTWEYNQLLLGKKVVGFK